jgi:hypothetical protein
MSPRGRQDVVRSAAAGGRPSRVVAATIPVTMAPTMPALARARVVPLNQAARCGQVIIPAVVCEELQRPQTPEVVRLWMAQSPSCPLEC